MIATIAGCGVDKPAAGGCRIHQNPLLKAIS